MNLLASFLLLASLFAMLSFIPICLLCQIIADSRSGPRLTTTITVGLIYPMSAFLGVGSLLYTPTAMGLFYGLLILITAAILVGVALHVQTGSLTVASSALIAFAISTFLLVVVRTIPAATIDMENLAVSLAAFVWHAIVYASLIHWTIQRRKLLKNACKNCGYNTQGLPSNTCPECGANFNMHNADQPTT